jgi:hypothetical protein
MHETGRLPMKASRSVADFAPQRYCWLSSPRQSWLLSGASMPHRRMRVPWISSVSPSMMLACPVSSDSPYRSGPSKVWLKSKNPLSEAARREREEAMNLLFEKHRLNRIA